MPKAFAEVDFSDSCSEGLMDGLGKGLVVRQTWPRTCQPGECRGAAVVREVWTGGIQVAHGITVIQIPHPFLRLQGQLVLTSRVIPRSTESRLGQLIYL